MQSKKAKNGHFMVIQKIWRGIIVAYEIRIDFTFHLHHSYQKIVTPIIIFFKPFVETIKRTHLAS